MAVNLLQGILKDNISMDYNITAIHQPGEAEPKGLETLRIKYVHLNMSDKKSLQSVLLSVKPDVAILIGSRQEDNGKQLRNLIDCCSVAKVLNMVLVSPCGMDTATHMWAKESKGIEDYCRQDFPKSIIVRVAPLDQLFLMFIDEKKRNELSFPTEGRVAPIDAKDVAEAIVTVLKTFKQHEGHTYELTGQKAENGLEFARDVSKALHRDVRLRTVSWEETKEILKSHEVPESRMDSYIELFRAVDRGEMDYTTNDFSKLTGHQPLDFSDFVRKTVSV